MIDLEMELYNEILTAYEKKQFNEGFEELELIKLMNLAKSDDYDKETLSKIVNNAIMLILVLFFQKNSQHLYEDHNFSHEDVAKLKNIFLNSLNGDAPM